MNFGKAIKNLRQSLLFSQEAFAQELGVSFTTVNRWESGKCKPSYKTLKLIDDYCKEHNVEFDVSKNFLEELK